MTVLAPAVANVAVLVAVPGTKPAPSPRSHSKPAIVPSWSIDVAASNVTVAPLATVAGAAVNAAVGVRENTMTGRVASVVLPPGRSSTTVTLAVNEPAPAYTCDAVGTVVVRSTPPPSKSHRYSTIAPSSVDPDASKVTASPANAGLGVGAARAATGAPVTETVPRITSGWTAQW